jgi:beta-phosphoglucomutase-like phosphatase (HAD superfamily)
VVRCIAVETAAAGVVAGKAVPVRVVFVIFVERGAWFIALPVST